MLKLIISGCHNAEGAWACVFSDCCITLGSPRTFLNATTKIISANITVITIKVHLDCLLNINPTTCVLNTTCVVNSDTLKNQLICFVHSAAMRSLWTKAGVLGSMSMAFGSLLWSQKKTDSEKVASASADTNPSSPYELKLVQVLFRHGARTPLKSIPDVMEVNHQVAYLLCL